MDKKMTGIVAYITWFGLIIALVAGDKEGAKFHINQSLAIWLVGTVGGFIPIVNIFVAILCLVCWVMGLIYAIQEVEKEVPTVTGKWCNSSPEMGLKHREREDRRWPVLSFSVYFAPVPHRIKHTDSRCREMPSAEPYS